VHEEAPKGPVALLERHERVPVGGTEAVTVPLQMTEESVVMCEGEQETEVVVVIVVR
jgi:hypothetical protein